ncbi:MAG: MaoC/PaaZ C-terminal domain-containing protein [Dermatophilaceae bacterium]
MVSVREIAAGQELGPVVVDVDRSRLVAYAAASGDHNRIHWDERFARSVGLPDVIAHGMWTMGAACALVCEWAGDSGAVLDYRTKFTAPVVVPYDGGARIEVRGVVAKVTVGTAEGPATAVVELTVTCAGEKVLTRAQARVRLGGG